MYNVEVKSSYNFLRKMSEFIGPALPPHLLNRISSSEDSDHAENNRQIQKNTEENVPIGPSLPSHMCQAASKDSLHFSLGSQTTVDEAVSTVVSCELAHKKKLNISNVNESTIGSTLPPKLRTKLSSKLSKISDSSDEEAVVMGPVLPPHLKNSSDENDSQDGPINVCVIGPRIPPFLMSKTDKQVPSEEKGHEKSKASVIGPSLPPHMKSKYEEELPTVVEDITVTDIPKRVIGPLIPANLLKNEKSKKDIVDIYGPALPPGLCQNTVQANCVSQDEALESDDEDVGPLPEGSSSASKVQHQLEIRARQLREAMLTGESSAGEVPTQRESWMLELPVDRAPELGLKPRQFRMRAAPEAGDRSVWTDTPEDRERKKKTPKSRSPDRGALERQAVKQRDKAMQQLAEQHSGKRGTRSLMEMHEEKLIAKRKKAEESGEVQERRPFSREVDLQVNRFDEAQKKSILKKAQHLNDRFSSGHSKFL